MSQSNGGVNQTNGNANVTGQSVWQNESLNQDIMRKEGFKAARVAVVAGSPVRAPGRRHSARSPSDNPSSDGSQSSNQDESVSNDTSQQADQLDPTANVPINVALLDSGKTSQSNRGVNQANGNARPHRTVGVAKRVATQTSSGGKRQDKSGKGGNGQCGCGKPDKNRPHTARVALGQPVV